MMTVPTVGTFVRSLLPVRLSGGYTVTFGVWLGIHPDDLERTFSVWWEPEYLDLRLEGRLANALPSWEVFAAPVVATVVNPDETPYVVSSTDPTLASVLANEWSPEQILPGLLSTEGPF